MLENVKNFFFFFQSCMRSPQALWSVFGRQEKYFITAGFLQ